MTSSKIVKPKLERKLDHPIADVFPLIEGKDFTDLIVSIRDHGLLEPITLFEDKILDGRNRYRACIEAGAEPRYEHLPPGTNPYAYVIDKNLRRRHSDESQRAVAAAKIAKMEHGGDRRSDQAANWPVVPTQAEAAAMLNVGERSVRRARVVLEQGAPELVQAVEQGQVSVSAAADIAKQPPDKQVEKVKELAQTARRKGGNPKPEPEPRRTRRPPAVVAAEKAAKQKEKDDKEAAKQAELEKQQAEQRKGEEQCDAEEARRVALIDVIVDALDNWPDRQNIVDQIRGEDRPQIYWNEIETCWRRRSPEIWADTETPAPAALEPAGVAPEPAANNNKPSDSSPELAVATPPADPLAIPGFLLRVASDTNTQSSDASPEPKGEAA